MIWDFILGAMLGVVIGGLLGFWFGMDWVKSRTQKRDDLLREAGRALAVVAHSRWSWTGHKQFDRAREANQLVHKIINEFVDRK